MNLRTRFAIVTAAIVFTLATAMSIGAYSIASAQLENQVAASLNQRATRILNTLNDPRFSLDDAFGRGPVNQAILQTEVDAITQLVSSDGTVYKRPEYPTLPVTAADLALVAGRANHRYVDIGGHRFRMLTVAAPNGGLIQLAKDTQIVVNAQAGMRRWFPLFAALAVVVSAGFGWLFARRISHPIEDLAATAEDIAATRNLDRQVTVSGDGEVGQLAGSFNSMIAALRDSTERQRRLVQDASHELRTPLTSLRANTEILGRSLASDDDTQSILSDMRAEMDRLVELSAELNALATDQRSAEDPQQVDLAEVAGEIVTRASRRSNAPVTLHTTDDTVVDVRPSQFERALSNLVDNAIKFSGGNAAVEVHVGHRRIEVRDHGPGIADVDKPKVFDRFYRSDLTRSMPGSGLGLAIVAQFAQDHGANVYVLDNADGGAIVGIQFP